MPSLKMYVSFYFVAFDKDLFGRSEELPAYKKLNMGTTQTKLEDSKVSRREKKYWWKRGKTYITKKKKFEIHDGIPQEYEEIIEETKCEDYTKFKRTEIKTVHNRSGEPIQERDLKSSLMIASAKAGIKPDTFQTETIKKQPNMCMYKGRKDCRNLKGKSVYSSSSLDSGFKSSCKEKMFQPESRDNFATASVFDQYDIEQKFEKESNDETNEKILGPSRGTCEFHSIRDVKRKETIDSSSKLMLSMNGTDSMKNIPNHKNNKRKVSLNSLLDERKSSISSVSSHTEMKTRVTDMMPNLGMTHELQSMEQLKPNTYYNETNGESVEELKTFKETDDTDEEEADSNITDVKELSSSYPDSDLCSENSKIFTHSSEESFSLSSCRSQSSKADSTTMAKEVERYNNLSKTSTIKLGCDHNVINTLNISATDDKKSSTVTTNLKSTESSYCSTGPVMNSINGKMDSCEANQSEVRIGKDTVIIGMPTQSDIPDKASKGGNEIDDLTAFCIYMLKNKDRKCGQEETQKKEKIIIDFEVDYNNKNMPSVNKGLTARGQTRTSDEFLLNLEHSDIIHGIHGHENDFAEANVEVKVFLHVIFCLFLMILLYGKRKEEVKHEIESSLDDSMMHKTEMTVDKTVSNEQVISLDRADASAIHPGVNSPDNDSIISEIKSEISDTSDRCMIESEVNVNGEDRENVTIKLLLSDRVDDPVFQLKETSTEIDYNESVITVAENIEPVQNSFNQNENQLDCFDDTQVEQDNGDSIIANDYETDHKGYKMRPKESNCDVKLRIKIDILCTEKNCKVECQCDNILKLCEQEHHNYESKRVDNCAVGNYESKFKLSGSVERENGANHMPMDSSFNKKIECFLPSVDTKNSSLACKDENSIDKCCDRTFESLNKCQDRYESKVDLNGNLKNENHKKTDEGICTAHIDTYIKARKENGLIQKDTGTTDLVRPNRTDDKFSDNTAENISVGPFWNQKKCSPYMKNIANANIKIGATKRALKVKHDKLGTSQITDQQSLSSEDSIYYSHHSSGNSKIWQRNNKHRFRKNKKVSKKRGSLKESNICTTPVERDCESNTLQRKSFKAENFCHKCHHSKNSQNKNCSECRILDGELGSGKFQCQVRSKDDSGISSLLSSLRSSILSEMEHIQSFETTKLPGLKNRGKLIEKYYKLGTLNKELRNISKRFNDGVLLNTDHDIVVLPGLQSYFDSLRNGGTPSFQERMRYEWLRLMSFSITLEEVALYTWLAMDFTTVKTMELTASVVMHPILIGPILIMFKKYTGEFHQIVPWFRVVLNQMKTFQ